MDRYLVHTYVDTLHTYTNKLFSKQQKVRIMPVNATCILLTFTKKFCENIHLFCEFCAKKPFYSFEIVQIAVSRRFIELFYKCYRMTLSFLRTLTLR